ncbi:MAG TPA: hypothetical protein EYO59_04125 [Chromatiaceae bacterium]|nr:hypothetical protein [Chromatiaceae bacterium]
MVLHKVGPSVLTIPQPVAGISASVTPTAGESPTAPDSTPWMMVIVSTVPSVAKGPGVVANGLMADFSAVVAAANITTSPAGIAVAVAL